MEDQSVFKDLIRDYLTNELLGLGLFSDQKDKKPQDTARVGWFAGGAPEGESQFQNVWNKFHGGDFSKQIGDFYKSTTGFGHGMGGGYGNSPLTLRSNLGSYAHPLDYYDTKMTVWERLPSYHGGRRRRIA